MNSIVVFCGSSKGFDHAYEELSKMLGKTFAEKDIRLVYGAGNVGLMGVMADSILEHKGKVLGVIPNFLKEKEVCHRGLTELIVTKTMHERKQIMAEECDGVIMIPGGFGTLDEFFEMLTWKQLHLHQKPIGILNIKGYYDHLINHIHHMVKEGFVKTLNLDLFVADAELEKLLDKMENATSEIVGKWADMNLE